MSTCNHSASVANQELYGSRDYIFPLSSQDNSSYLNTMHATWYIYRRVCQIPGPYISNVYTVCACSTALGVVDMQS